MKHEKKVRTDRIFEPTLSQIDEKPTGKQVVITINSQVFTSTRQIKRKLDKCCDSQENILGWKQVKIGFHDCNYLNRS